MHIATRISSGILSRARGPSDAVFAHPSNPLMSDISMFTQVFW